MGKKNPNYPDKRDWEPVRHDYIVNRMSYRKLHDKYHVSESAIKAKVDAEHWRERREEYWRRVADRVLAEAENRDVGELSRLIEASRKLDERILQFLDGGLITTARDLADVSSAIKLAAMARRSLCDMTTKQEDRAHDLAVRRLEMEIERIKSGDSPTEVHVVIDGDEFNV